MREKLLFTILLSSFTFYSQQQIGNSGFEQWDNLGAPNEEPSNWNSFKTGSGSLNLAHIKHISKFGFLIRISNALCDQGPSAK